MVETKESFLARLNDVDYKHSRLVRRGYTTRVDHNGLIVVQPKKRRLHFPARGAFLLVLGFFLFKAVMLSANGPATYGERLEQLESGTILEVMAARTLSIDPATQFLADQIGPLLR